MSAAPGTRLALPVPRALAALSALTLTLVLAAPARAGTTVVSAGVPGPSAAFSEVTVVADCGGRTVSGGGARLDQGAQASLANGLHVDGSVPLDGRRWLAAGGGGGAVPSDGLTAAYAVCLDGDIATTVVVAAASGPTGTFQETRATATCSPGTALLSGGARTTPGTVGSLKPRASYPSDAAGTPVLGGPAPDSWTAVGLNGGGGNQKNTTYAYALCAVGTPPVLVAHAQVPGPATASTAARATASCPSGTTLLGGGASISDGFGLPGSQGDHLTGSYPSDAAGTPIGAGTAGSWTAATHTGGVDSGSLTQTDAWALCASEPAAPPPLPGAAPANLAPPSISGTADAGALLTVIPGRWSGSPMLAYTWLRCDTVCAEIATGPRYRLARADVGSRIRVREAAAAGAGTIVSTATGWVQGRPTTAEIRAELGRRLAPRGKPGHIDTLLATGGVTLPMKSLTPGRASIRWRARGTTVASGRHAFADARTGTIRLRLTAAGKRALRHTDRLAITAEATFTRRGRPSIRTTRRFAVEQGSGRAATARTPAEPHDRQRATPTPFTRLIGGTGEDAVRAIAVDRAGNTYVTGETTSRDLPTTLGAPNRGVPISAFVAKLNPRGEIVYLRYLGGTRYTSGRGIAVDARGRAYVTGATNSTDFPTTAKALQRSYGGGPFDAFAARLDPAGRLDYATFLGDTHYDEANAIAVDRQGRAVVTGRTVSPAFPVAGGLRPPVAGGAFVARLDATGHQLTYSAVFGGGDRGNHGNAGFAVALDKQGTAYVTGVTNAARFPLVHAFQTELQGGGDAFVLAVDARRVLYSTYLGRSGDDVGRGIAVTPGGTAYVTGLSGGATFLARIAPRGRRLTEWHLIDGAAGGVGIALDDHAHPHVDSSGFIAIGPTGEQHRASNANGDVIVTG